MTKDQGSLSGFRDILSAQMLARRQVTDKVTAVFERYGFMPIKTPAIEKYETLNGKYGEEASTLIYDFKDRGQRHLALRYDHTVPLARLLAAHGSSLLLPYKRYVVGDVWRGESPQAGRYREFTQIDADIVGSDSYLADSEVLMMMHDIFADLDIKVTIAVNDRRILDGLGEACGISNERQFYQLIGLIDKVGKIGPEAVLKEISSHFSSDVSSKLSKLFESKVVLDDVLAIANNDKIKAGISSLKQIITALKPLGLDNVKFDPTIARGLNYYTSTIYETLVDDMPAIGSVCSGGRYNNLIAQLGGPNLPAIGTSIGLDRLMDASSQLSQSQAKTRTVAYIVNLDPSIDSDRLKLAYQLRAAGIPTEIYYSEAKLAKQLETIDKLGIGLAIIYGPKEQQNSIALIREIGSGSQREVALNDLVSELKSF